ncbi:YciI family protein [Zavarzinia compransoris]|uniref:YciI family protein n=1 Tax=Zavarzinia marina TaxID=2911065 RepID=UPI001F15DCCA|nr:YciI family protein [Zavarzinia marina]MCF4166806.1 YciI family protein [Zavarzinia marina]
MHFAVICTDKPGGMEIRLANRPAHLEWLKAPGSRIRIAGPFTTDDGAAMTGSMLVIEAEDAATAEAYCAEDPYARAGLFAKVEIKPWKWVIGQPAEV